MNFGGGQSVDSSGEVEALEFLRRHTLAASQTFTVFDVGANDGTYAASALRVFGSRAKVFSFEPQSANFQGLHARFANDPRIEIWKAALGRAEGSAELFFSREGETTASLNRTHTSQVRTETVRVTTVDSVCAEGHIEHISLLKIDTEGYEMDVLQGAVAMIGKRAVSAIQFEFGDTFLHSPFHFVDFWDLLSPNYTIFRILRHGLFRITRYSPDLEIYKIANFLCLQKE
jgi:FkbM family methyltransferase